MMVRVAVCEDQRQTGKEVEQSFCGRQPARFRHHHIQNRYVRFVLLANEALLLHRRRTIPDTPVPPASAAPLGTILPSSNSGLENEEKFLLSISVLSLSNKKGGQPGEKP